MLTVYLPAKIDEFNNTTLPLFTNAVGTAGFCDVKDSIFTQGEKHLYAYVYAGSTLTRKATSYKTLR